MSGSERDPPPGRTRRPIPERTPPTAPGHVAPPSATPARSAPPATAQGVPLRGAVLRSAAPVIPPTAPSIDDLLADPMPARAAPSSAPRATTPRAPNLRAPEPADDPWAEQTPAAPPPEAARAWATRARTSGSPGWAGLVDLDDAHAQAGPTPAPLRPEPLAAPVPPRGADARAALPRGLDLPLPVGAPLAPSRAALVDGLTLEPPAAAHPLDDLVAGPPSGARGPAPRGHVLREYREVIGIGLATVVAAGAAVAYLRAPAPRDDKPLVTPPVVQGTPSVAPTAVPTAATTSAATAPTSAPTPAPVEAAPVEVAAPRRAAVPLLSVLSDPPGAEVVVDGEVLGKTPLILPAPNVPLLVLTLKLDGYVDWVGQVKPSAAGHMSLSPTLRKR